MLFFGGVSWVYHQTSVYVAVYDQNSNLISKSVLAVSNFTDASYKFFNLFCAINRNPDDFFIFAFDDENFVQECKKQFLNSPNLFLIYAANLDKFDNFKSIVIFNPEHFFIQPFFCSVIAAFESYSLIKTR